MKINTKFMTRNDCYTASKKIKPRGIMVHSTATPGVMAAQWFYKWNKSFKAGETDVQACVHAFVDDKEAWQYLPWDHRGWHCGGKANDTHIGFELCEPDGFSYGKGAAMLGYDTGKNELYFRAVWENAIALCVVLCKQFKLNETHIIDHAEGHRLGVASNHADVGHWFPRHGESMNTFRAAVRAALQYDDIRENIMTQEQFNRMFAVAMKAYNKDLAALPPSDWAKETWDKAVAAGLLDGSAPRGALTREQAAAVLSRLI